MSEKKNKKVMSIAIEPDLHESVKEYAKRKGVSASTYIGELVEKALTINIDDEPIIIGLEQDMFDKITELTKQKGVSVTAYIGDLIKKVSKINVEDEAMVVGKSATEMPVILKIPAHLKGDLDNLRNWMESKCQAIIKQLTP